MVRLRAASPGLCELHPSVLSTHTCPDCRGYLCADCAPDPTAVADCPVCRTRPAREVPWGASRTAVWLGAVNLAVVAAFAGLLLFGSGGILTLLLAAWSWFSFFPAALGAGLAIYAATRRESRPWVIAGLMLNVAHLVGFFALVARFFLGWTIE